MPIDPTCARCNGSAPSRGHENEPVVITTAGPPDPEWLQRLHEEVQHWKEDPSHILVFPPSHHDITHCGRGLRIHYGIQGQMVFLEIWNKAGWERVDALRRLQPHEQHLLVSEILRARAAGAGDLHAEEDCNLGGDALVLCQELPGAGGPQRLLRLPLALEDIEEEPMDKLGVPDFPDPDKTATAVSQPDCCGRCGRPLDLTTTPPTCHTCGTQAAEERSARAVEPPKTEEP